MKFEILRAYLADKPGASEEFPFGPEPAVYKVMGKMFALVRIGKTPLEINLKCDPDLALSFREVYAAVLPGFHMNKKHWNTLILNGSIPDNDVFSMIDDSYALVVKGLRKTDRKKLSER